MSQHRSISGATAKGSGRMSKAPAWIFDMSRIELTTASRCWPDCWMIAAYSRRLAASSRHQLRVGEHFGEADDRVERRAQLVADVGEELILPDAGFFGGGARGVEVHLALLGFADVAEDRDDAVGIRLAARLERKAPRPHFDPAEARLVAGLAGTLTARRRKEATIVRGEAAASEMALRKAGRSATWM